MPRVLFGSERWSLLGGGELRERLGWQLSHSAPCRASRPTKCGVTLITATLPSFLSTPKSTTLNSGTRLLSLAAVHGVVSSFLPHFPHLFHWKWLSLQKSWRKEQQASTLSSSDNQLLMSAMFSLHTSMDALYKTCENM